MKRIISSAQPLGLLILIITTVAGAQSRMDCSALKSQILHRPVRYCVYLPSEYDAGATQHPPRRYPVLYLLHGLGDNEQTLFNSVLAGISLDAAVAARRALVRYDPTREAIIAMVLDGFERVVHLDDSDTTIGSLRKLIA